MLIIQIIIWSKSLGVYCYRFFYFSQINWQFGKVRNIVMQQPCTAKHFSQSINYLKDNLLKMSSFIALVSCPNHQYVCAIGKVTNSSVPINIFSQHINYLNDNLFKMSRRTQLSYWHLSQNYPSIWESGKDSNTIAMYCQTFWPK